MTDSERPDLAQEISAMVSSVQEWARRALPESSIGHGDECQWCPLCQLVQVLRGEHPEVTERLAEAGRAVVGALTSLADVASRPPERPQPEPRVERIDLDS